MNQLDSPDRENASRRTFAKANPQREVYFVQAETLGLIKIGFAVSAKARLKTMQVGSPDRLKLIGSMPCSQFGALEQEVHARFKALRVHGEWHRPEPELLAFISQHAGAAAFDQFMREQRDMANAIMGAPASPPSLNGSKI